MKLIKIFLYFFILVIIAGLLLVGFVLYGLSQFYQPGSGGQVQAIKIEKGEGVKEIAQTLNQQGIIKSPFWFETYVWLNQGEKKLQAGDYSIDPKLSVAQIFDLVSGGKVIDNTVRVTIPEGFGLGQIKSRLAESGLNIDGFDKLSAGQLKDKYPILSAAPDYASLEGFLFPDTYQFKKDATLNEVIEKMLDNFDAKIDAKMRADIAARKISVYQAITMASILEKEVRGQSDRQIASGIFWQRLSDDYPLQSDATLSYIFGDKIDRHSIDETKVDSPYNTYKYAGLPPGPINNPGLDAIEAAIYPQKTDYYYFLTKPDTGEAVFAKTLKEHNANVAKYLK